MDKRILGEVRIMGQKFLSAIVFGVLSMLTFSFASGQGIVLPTSGPINRGMAGATTGAAIDALGSTYWNPATISGLDSNEIGFGLELGLAPWTVESTFPGVGSGSTNAESGAIPIPSVGWVYQTQNPRLKFGLSFAATAGYSSNLPADATNPVLSPPLALGGVGLGNVQAEATFFQVAPSFAYVLTDKLSVGFGPTVTMGRITIDDNVFAVPNANGLYPQGNGTRYHWGLGAQLGFYYQHNSLWSFGANLKTPTWMEPLRYFGETATGLPRVDKNNFDLPLIATFGTAYRPNDNSIFTVDLRYFNYTDTSGWGDDAGFNADLTANGLGWDDVFSLHLGSQVRMTQRLTARAGYLYASELFDDEDTFFNVGSDLSYQHAVSVGGSYDLSCNTQLSFAYTYTFPFESTGPFVAPGIGPIPGSSVTNDVTIHLVDFGVNVRY